ncbi:uncharacterized protein LOC132997427 [Limanda limanda]|uniref:uncharacterized protein LOC132997427 n=1 Tax=Limanda limanda TaxID=27771 RepID=UPI0029C5FC70|nr:uncharacterized protein LOC132997427 [Limanda limanda]
MAARSRITVLLLLFLLSTEHSFAVTEDELTPLVDELLSKYRFNGMFSLAVSIPLNQNQNQNQNQNKNQGANRDLEEVLGNNTAANVENKINKGEVYVGSRMVAAKSLKRGNVVDHAESRVVDELSQLYDSPQFNPDDLLLFYVYASPCDHKCTNSNHQGNILSKISNIRRWNNWAVVFSKMFKPSDGSANTDKKISEALIKARRESLNQLAMSKGEPGSIGLENIFCCDYENHQMKCVSCSSDGQVAEKCVSYDPPSARAMIYYTRRQRQCVDRCQYFESGSYFWCHDEDGWEYCSPLPDHTYKNEACRSDHKCGSYGESYTWCYTTSNNDWDYCGVISPGECVFSQTSRAKRQVNIPTWFCRRVDANRRVTIFGHEGDSRKFAQTNRDLRREADELINRWNNQGLNNQPGQRTLIESANLRIDKQGMVNRNNQPYYNLQIQINGPRRPGHSTTVSVIIVPVDTPAEYMRFAFRESLRRRLRVVLEPSNAANTLPLCNF